MKTTLDYSRNSFALVLVDIQTRFLEATPGLHQTMEDRLSTVNEAIKVFRKADRPVIYIRYVGPTHSCSSEEIYGNGFVKDMLQPEWYDIVVEKKGMNSFLDSNLATIIKQTESDSILIAGMVAQYCVLATYFGAFDYGISPYMLEHGIAATDQDNIDAVEFICKTMSLEELKKNGDFNSSQSRSLRRFIA